MPISVKHGGGLPGLAGLLGGTGQYATRESQLRGQDMRFAIELVQRKRQQQAQRNLQADVAAASNMAARSRQAASIKAQSANSQRQIQAQAQRQSQAATQASKRLIVQAGLQREFADEAYDREIQKMEEQARQKAGERKQIYTEEGKRQIAQGNRLIEWANDQTSDASPEMRREAFQKGQAMASGVRSVGVPDTSKKYPDGQGVDEQWTNNAGDLVSRDANGKIYTITPFRYSKKFLLQEQQREQQKVQEDYRRDRTKEAVSAFQTIRGRKVPTGKVVDGKPTEEYTSPIAAEAEVHRLFPDVELFIPREKVVARQAAEQAAIQREQTAAVQAKKEALIKGLEAKGYKVVGSQRDLPSQVMVASVMMAKMLRDYGVADPRRLPQTVRNRYNKAQAIVAEFRGLSDR